MVPGAILVSKAPYRMNTCELVELKLQLYELISNGDIRPIFSPWGAPILFVKNKGIMMRMCIDNQQLIRLTIKNRHQHPKINDMLDQVREEKIFSNIELRSRHHQVRIQEKTLI